MLSLNVRLKDSIDVGTARVTLLDYRNDRLELLILIGKAISVTSILEGHDTELIVDGAKVVLGYRPVQHHKSPTRFIILIGAPPEIIISRREVCHERQRDDNTPSTKELANVE